MATIRGTNRDDILGGTEIADQLFGFAGDDILLGRGGHDRLSGGSGSDVLYGHAGNDTMDGGSGGDLIDGGTGTDTLLPAMGAEGIEVNLRLGYAATGDEFDALAAMENAVGTAGTDSLSGNASANVLLGLAGDDLLGGYSGSDRLVGGAGADSLSGDDGNDHLLGESGDDLLDGGSGDDLLSGGDGIDYVFGGSGRDKVRGAAGNDELNGGPGNDVLEAGSGSDKFVYEVFLDGSTNELSHGGQDLFADFNKTTDVIAVFNDGDGFLSFQGDELFLALDSNHSGRLDKSDAFVDIRGVSYEGHERQSTVIDIGGLISDAAQFEDYVAGTAQLTVFGVTGLALGDIFGI